VELPREFDRRDQARDGKVSPSLARPEQATREIVAVGQQIPTDPTTHSSLAPAHEVSPAEIYRGVATEHLIDARGQPLADLPRAEGS
jgi:hypothetical protein